MFTMSHKNGTCKTNLCRTQCRLLANLMEKFKSKGTFSLTSENALQTSTLDEIEVIMLRLTKSNCAVGLLLSFASVLVSFFRARARVCVCVCVCDCVRACVRACVCGLVGVEGCMVWVGECVRV